MTLLFTMMIGVAMLKKVIFFDKLKEVNLTINMAKSRFGCAQVSFLGQIVGQGEVQPIATEVETISVSCSQE